MLLLIAAIGLLCLTGTLTGQECPALQEEDWSYQGANGPEFWGDLKESYQQCNGDSQSPINIKDDDIIPTNLPSLLLINYDVPVTSATIVNDGHTVQIESTDGIWRGFTIDKANFTLNQFHFHWGTVPNTGSEHLFDYDQFSLEMHLVHTSNESPSTTGVVGVIYQQTLQDLAGLNPIVNTLENVKYKDQEATLSENLVLNDLLPSNPLSYYTYEGSLTTPGCDEGVKWLVATEVISVGNNQMREFRKVYAVTEEAANSESCKLADNFRPVQPLNNRAIYRSRFPKLILYF